MTVKSSCGVGRGDLKEVWSKYNSSIVSEDTILARSIYPDLKKYFLPPFVLGRGDDLRNRDSQEVANRIQR